MKLALVVIGLSLLAISCQRTELRVTEPLNMDAAVAPDVNVVLEVERHRYTPGETIVANIRVRNVSDSTLVVKSKSSVPASIVAYRETPLGWEKIREYPIDAPKQESVWTLDAGQMTLFQVPVPVAAEWPENTNVKLVAQISGREELKPEVQIFVLSQTSVVPHIAY